MLKGTGSGVSGRSHPNDCLKQLCTGGTCTNRLSIAREKLEGAVLAALQSHLMREDLCEAFCQEYIRQSNALRSEHNAARAATERELGQVKRQLTQMVDAIAEGAPLDPIKDRMHALDARRKELEQRLNTTQDEVVLFHPAWRRAITAKSGT